MHRAYTLCVQYKGLNKCNDNGCMTNLSARAKHIKTSVNCMPKPKNCIAAAKPLKSLPIAVLEKQIRLRRRLAMMEDNLAVPVIIRPTMLEDIIGLQ